MMKPEDEIKSASLTYALLRYVKQEENIDVQIGAVAQTLCLLIKKKTDDPIERRKIISYIGFVLGRYFGEYDPNIKIPIQPWAKEIWPEGE